MTNALFFDSYAIIEIIKGNENYKKYSNVKIITTKLNLFEVYYYLLKDGVEDPISNKIIEKYETLTIDFNIDIIKDAAKFKLKHKRANLSMTDCIGYNLSNCLSIKFLTGDKEFEKMENVEFVK